jgi:hypothetical protein
MVRLAAPCVLVLLAFTGCATSPSASRTTGNCAPRPDVEAWRAPEPHTITVRWSVPVPASSCGQARLLITALSTSGQSGAVSADGSPKELTSDHGTAQIHLRATDQPPYRVTASVFTRAGRGESEAVSVRGEDQPSPASAQRAQARASRCRAVADVAKVCPATTGSLVSPPRTFPLRAADPVALAGSVRRKLEQSAGADQKIASVACTAGGVCNAALTTDFGKYSARLRLWLKGTGPRNQHCYTLSRWAVIDPTHAPGAENAAIPLVHDGCTF